MVADQTGGYAGLLGQRLRLVGRENQPTEALRTNMTELSRTEGTAILLARAQPSSRKLPQLFVVKKAVTPVC
jgi:hypothetical protein